MELERALESAVILGWEDLSKVATPSLVRVEYEFESRQLEHLSVWLIKPRGYQDLVYEHWAKPAWDFPAGSRFANGHRSQPLADALTFVLHHQDQFQHAADRAKHRLLVYPPSEAEHREAARWLRGLSSAGPVADGDAAREGNLAEPAQSLAECVR
jgi:hypothetical protein